MEAADGRVKLAAIAVGGDREAAIWREPDGSIQCGTGGFQAVAQGSDPFLARVPDGTLVFGRLPAGATRVEVRAAVAPREVVVAGDAYLAMLPARLDNRQVCACFRDDRGAVVPVDLPTSERVLSRAPVSDANTVCRACGACDWEAVQVRAPAHLPLTREQLLICRVCGRQEGNRHGAGRQRPLQASNLAREAARPPGVTVDSTPGEVIRAAGFAAHALAEEIEAKRDLGWSESDAQIDSLRVTHTIAVDGRDVEIEVTSWLPSDDAEGDPRTGLVGHLADALYIERVLQEADTNPSGPALHLAAATHLRETFQQAEQASIRVVTIPVGDDALSLTVAESSDGAWVAIGRHEGVDIALRGRGLRPEGLRLAIITDPEQFFAATARKRTAREDG